ncbi:hypothetical protein HDU87_007591 [Geranomyces variabilis]|uniref:Uncharacterized protein n=1 Tax=Geranomyces variabilis TaxID=109894 RepID=A0AAD5TDZ0_9FUNG|nr:hypothetical protein HDU87_007591 [Geranomyces variabilis]
MDSPQHTVHTVLEPLLVASTADAPPAPAPAPLRPSRGKHRPCSCTCRAFCAAIILAFTLLFVAVAIATTYFFDPSEAFISSDSLYKESKAESFPVKPFYNESTSFDVYLQVQRTAEGADPVDVFAGRILTGTPLAGLQGDSVTLRLPALGPLNVSQPQPLAAQVAIVHSSHDYSVDDLFKLKPDHSAEGFASAGAWATNSTSPPVFLRKVHLIRYLWRPVDSVLPIPDKTDTANTTAPSSPHMVLRLPMHFLEEKTVYDGIRMQQLATKYKRTVKLCEEEAKTEQEKKVCPWNDVTIVSRFAYPALQPYARMITTQDQRVVNGTAETFYLPAFVFSPRRLAPVDFVPFDHELGLPKGQKNDEGHFSVKLSASLCTGETSGIVSAMEMLPRSEESRFFQFPPRFANATYHVDQAQFLAETEHFYAGGHPIEPILAAHPWLRVMLNDVGYLLLFSAASLEFVYFLTRHSTVGISRTGIQIAAAWEGVIAVSRMVEFARRPKGNTGFFTKAIVALLAALAQIWEGNTLAHGLALSAAALFVTQKCFIEWNGWLPRFRSDLLTKNERKSDRDDSVSWLHRVALLAGLTIIVPLVTANAKAPTSLSAVYHLYRHRANYWIVGPIARVILQFRLNRKRRTFAGEYKLAQWMALLNHVLSLTLLMVSAPAKLYWASWAQICIDLVGVGQALAYPSAPNIRESVEYAE